MIYGDYGYRLTVTQKINILATRTSILVAGKAPYYNQAGKQLKVYLKPVTVCIASKAYL